MIVDDELGIGGILLDAVPGEKNRTRDCLDLAEQVGLFVVPLVNPEREIANTAGLALIAASKCLAALPLVETCASKPRAFMAATMSPIRLCINGSPQL
jgi:hypothetical protein